MTSSRRETIAMPDGATMGAHVSLPDAGRGPGLVVLMEIFGVGTYIRRACDRLAELGYVALAPDLYRRVEPGLELAHDEPGLARALECAGKLDVVGAVDDAAVALEHLRGLPEVDGARCGALGFCLGGTLAWQLAAGASPATAVCYYGSGIAGTLDLAQRIQCPVLLHFGAQDQYIPLADAERVAAVAAEREGWECEIQPDGGHAFDNHDAPMFSQPEPAARAWAITRSFLARTLPV